jgi:hypothetical protein
MSRGLRIADMRNLRILLSLCVGATLCGCGPSADDIVNRHRPAYAALKAKLAKLADKLPAGRIMADQPPVRPFDPQLVLSTDDATGNAEAVMVEHLTSDDARPEFDLNLSSDLTAALAWTAEGRSIGGGDPAFMDATLTRGLNLRYLVVHRIADLKLPEAVTDREYRPGSVVVEGFVFDLGSEELVASYTATATTDDRVEATVLPDEKDAEALVRFARSTLWSNCRKAIAQKLQSVVGGSATID